MSQPQLNGNYHVYSKSIINLPKGRGGKRSIVSLKKHLFMNYGHTAYIAQYIEDEDWGESNKRLFSYLDYTFRARLNDNEIYLYMSKNVTVGVFYVGLKSKRGNSDLYLVFKPNPDVLKKQEWCLPDIQDASEFLMTRNSISKKYGIRDIDLPPIPYYLQRNYIYHPEWRLQLCWDYDLRILLNHKTGGNTRNIILNEFAANGIKLDSKLMRQKLLKPLDRAVVEAVKNYHNDNSYVRPGVYFSERGYKIVHQMLLNVEYPENSGKITKFVAVIEKVKNKKVYEFTRLLNIEMAYKNARLVGPVPKSWNFAQSTKKRKPKYNNNNYNNNNNNNNNSKISNLQEKLKNLRVNTSIDTISMSAKNSEINGSVKTSPYVTPYTTPFTTPYVTPNTSPYSSSSKATLLDDYKLKPEDKESKEQQPQPQQPPQRQPPQQQPQQLVQQSIGQLNALSSFPAINFQNQFPKNFKGKKAILYVLQKDYKTIVETINYVKAEIINGKLSVPIQTQNILKYDLTKAPKEIQSNILISPILKISSNHEICQFCPTNCLETVSQTITLLNGTAIQTMKSYLHATDAFGVTITTEMPFIKPLSNNNYNNNIQNN